MTKVNSKYHDAHSCVVSNLNNSFLRYFKCIVQYSLYYNMHIGTMWHCASVSCTPSWSIGLGFGLTMFWCWVPLCVPFTNSLIGCYFFMMVAILLILIHRFGIYVTRWFWFCKFALFWVFLSLDILFEYWIEHVAFGLLYVMLDFYRIF